MKRFIQIAAVLLMVLTVLSACRSDVVYCCFYPMESNEWHVDSVKRFEYTITDNQADYNLVVYVRHNERYPYQNMWLFFGDSQQRDTIEFYLADDRGQWLGNTHNGFIEMPVLLEEKMHYRDTGTYYLELQHGMRDSLLRGITDIGLEIRKNE